jgi:hypothetical protein
LSEVTPNQLKNTGVNIMTEQAKGQTVSNPVKAVVSRIDDPSYTLFDEDLEYCHCDFKDEIIEDSCIYLNTLHQGDHFKTIILSKVDAIAIAKKFKLTADDLSC